MNDDFSAARNESLKHAAKKTGFLCLMLTKVYPKESVAAIKKIVGKRRE